MKKLIFLFTSVALALIFSAFTGTGGKMIVKIEKGESAKTIRLQLANLQDLRTCITIQDMEGIHWFDNYVWGEKGYAVNLNTQGMPEGDYFFEIKNRDNRHVQAFSIGKNDIAFFKEQPATAREKSIARFASLNINEKSKLITYFTDEGNHKLGVQLANLQYQPALLRMVSLETGTMLTKEIAGVEGYAAKWNMEGMGDTDYLLYVRSGDANVVVFFQLNKNRLEMQSIQRFEHPVIRRTKGNDIIISGM